MTYTLFRTTSFKKAFKKLSMADQDAVLEVVAQLIEGETLDARFKDHLLSGNFKGCRECHVKPELLLVYKINETILELTLVEAGSHAQLFG